MHIYFALLARNWVPDRLMYYNWIQWWCAHYTYTDRWNSDLRPTLIFWIRIRVGYSCSHMYLLYVLKGNRKKLNIKVLIFEHWPLEYWSEALNPSKGGLIADLVTPLTDFFCYLKYILLWYIYYSSNKIRKAQNEHLKIVCQNLIGFLLWFKANFLTFWRLYLLFFDLEYIGVKSPSHG